MKGKIFCNYCQKETYTHEGDCDLCNLSKPTGKMMQAEIDKLRADVSEKREIINKYIALNDECLGVIDKLRADLSIAVSALENMNRDDFRIRCMGTIREGHIPEAREALAKVSND